jgi:GntR family transcriptional regulator, transcriptional repressor for pyruvate dehydrogenase complex
MITNKISVPRRKTDVTGKLISAFKQLISDGSLLPGSKLPSERDLAESFGVARSSLRQALKVLEIMGVISQRVGDGTYLNGGALPILAEPLEFLILLEGITFPELMEARLIVEPELAARAAERATSDELAELGRSMDGMSKKRMDRTGFVEQDMRFHRAVFQASGNRVCSLMFTEVQRAMRKLMDVTSQLTETVHTLKLHRQVYEAIVKRDPEAARRRMLEHLTDAKGLILNAVEYRADTRLRARISDLSIRMR